MYSVTKQVLNNLPILDEDIKFHIKEKHFAGYPPTNDSPMGDGC